MTKNPTTHYMDQLGAALKKNKVKDIDDILADYTDYFAQSKAKGYTDAEAMRRLPSAQKLAASYKDDEDNASGDLPGTSIGQNSSTQKAALFGATLLGDIFLFPVFFIAVLMLVCFGAVGFFLAVTGPLLFIPDSILGQLDVARPSLSQLLPTAFLFIASGVAIMGVCIALFERTYSGYRASIVMRRRLLLGKHTNHLKLVPSVSKQFRTVLYKTTLIAAGVALLALLILMSLAWFTEGTINFPSTWGL